MDSDAALDLSSLAGCEPALALATIDQCRASLQRGGPLAFDVSVLLGALRAQLVPDADEHLVLAALQLLVELAHAGGDDAIAAIAEPATLDAAAAGSLGRVRADRCRRALSVLLRVVLVRAPSASSGVCAALVDCCATSAANALLTVADLARSSAEALLQSYASLVAAAAAQLGCAGAAHAAATKALGGLYRASPDAFAAAAAEQTDQLRSAISTEMESIAAEPAAKKRSSAAAASAAAAAAATASEAAPVAVASTAAAEPAPVSPIVSAEFEASSPLAATAEGLSPHQAAGRLRSREGGDFSPLAAILPSVLLGRLGALARSEMSVNVAGTLRSLSGLESDSASTASAGPPSRSPAESGWAERAVAAEQLLTRLLSLSVSDASVLLLENEGAALRELLSIAARLVRDPHFRTSMVGLSVLERALVLSAPSLTRYGAHAAASCDWGGGDGPYGASLLDAVLAPVAERFGDTKALVRHAAVKAASTVALAFGAEALVVRVLALMFPVYVGRSRAAAGGPAAGVPGPGKNVRESALRVLVQTLMLSARRRGSVGPEATPSSLFPVETVVLSCAPLILDATVKVATSALELFAALNAFVSGADPAVGGCAELAPSFGALLRALPGDHAPAILAAVTGRVELMSSMLPRINASGYLELPADVAVLQRAPTVPTQPSLLPDAAASSKGDTPPSQPPLRGAEALAGLVAPGAASLSAAAAPVVGTSSPYARGGSSLGGKFGALRQRGAVSTKDGPRLFSSSAVPVSPLSSPPKVSMHVGAGGDPSAEEAAAFVKVPLRAQAPIEAAPLTLESMSAATTPVKASAAAAASAEELPAAPASFSSRLHAALGSADVAQSGAPVASGPSSGRLAPARKAVAAVLSDSPYSEPVFGAGPPAQSLGGGSRKLQGAAQLSAMSVPSAAGAPVTAAETPRGRQLVSQGASSYAQDAPSVALPSSPLATRHRPAVQTAAARAAAAEAALFSALSGAAGGPNVPTGSAGAAQPPGSIAMAALAAAPAAATSPLAPSRRRRGVSGAGSTVSATASALPPAPSAPLAGSITSASVTSQLPPAVPDEAEESVMGPAHQGLVGSGYAARHLAQRQLRGSPLRSPGPYSGGGAASAATSPGVGLSGASSSPLAGASADAVAASSRARARVRAAVQNASEGGDVAVLPSVREGRREVAAGAAAASPAAEGAPTSPLVSADVSSAWAASDNVGGAAHDGTGGAVALDDETVAEEAAALQAALEESERTAIGIRSKLDLLKRRSRQASRAGVSLDSPSSASPRRHDGPQAQNLAPAADSRGSPLPAARALSIATSVSSGGYLQYAQSPHSEDGRVTAASSVPSRSAGFGPFDRAALEEEFGWDPYSQQPASPTKPTRGGSSGLVTVASNPSAGSTSHFAIAASAPPLAQSGAAGAHSRTRAVTEPSTRLIGGVSPAVNQFNFEVSPPFARGDFSEAAAARGRGESDGMPQSAGPASGGAAMPRTHSHVSLHSFDSSPVDSQRSSAAPRSHHHHQDLNHQSLAFLQRGSSGSAASLTSSQDTGGSVGADVTERGVSAHDSDAPGSRRAAPSLHTQAYSAGAIRTSAASGLGASLASGGAPRSAGPLKDLITRLGRSAGPQRAPPLEQHNANADGGSSARRGLIPADGLSDSASLRSAATGDERPIRPMSNANFLHTTAAAEPSNESAASFDAAPPFLASNRTAWSSNETADLDAHSQQGLRFIGASGAFSSSAVRSAGPERTGQTMLPLRPQMSPVRSHSTALLLPLSAGAAARRSHQDWSSDPSVADDGGRQSTDLSGSALGDDSASSFQPERGDVASVATFSDAVSDGAESAHHTGSWQVPARGASKSAALPRISRGGSEASALHAQQHPHSASLASGVGRVRAGVPEDAAGAGDDDVNSSFASNGSAGTAGLPSGAPNTEKLYVPSSELQPLPPLTVDASFRAALGDLGSENWERAFEACVIVRRIALHHAAFLSATGGGSVSPSAVTESGGLQACVAALLPLTDSLRSSVAKISIMTLGDLFHGLGRGMDCVVDIVAPALIKRACDTNEFILQAARAALAGLLVNCGEVRVLVSLLNCGTHKNPNVRLKSAQWLDRAVARLGVRLSTVVRDSVLERLVLSAVRFSQEGSPEARHAGTRTLQRLVARCKAVDDKLLRRLLPERAVARVHAAIDKEGVPADAFDVDATAAASF